jgi:predicted transglutaminase-like cysteine proteinase
MKRTVLLPVLLTIILICGMLPAACHQGFSHQPSTINQMKMLVTPQEQTVTQALQEALATDDTAVSDAPSHTVVDINKMWLWVYSNIKQTSDFALHGVSDYWQTPTETLALKAGDCEDFAILMVSLLRAYCVPQDQVYVAVGDDVNKDWHAFVLERYSYGAWVEFDPEYVDDAVLLDGDTPLPYTISYCFNDQSGFNGTPGYPKGYDIPSVSIVPVVPVLGLLAIADINSHNQTLDEAKRRLGELWLPTYIPQDYIFTVGSISSFGDSNYLSLTYQAGVERQLNVSETNNLGFDTGIFQPGTLEQSTINNHPAYFGVITYTLRTGSSSIIMNMLVLDFIQDSLVIKLSVTPTDLLTHEELVKIAESFVEY